MRTVDLRLDPHWIVPIEPAGALSGHALIVDDGAIVALVPAAVADRDYAARSRVELPRHALMPGLVNAHTHLELSYLRGQVPAGSSFVAWIRAVMAARRQYSDPSAPTILDAVDRGIAEALRSGTAIVGDISNTLVTFDRVARSPLAAVIFYELIGFRAPDPEVVVARAKEQIGALSSTDRVRVSLAAHAPYSVAPLMLRAIRHALDHDPFATCSVHLAESAEEIEFIRTGGGPWRGLLEELGVWDAAWAAPGVSPVQYLDENGFLGGRVMAVHGVQADAADLARLLAQGTTLVTCPRSNEHTGAGTPPIEAFYASGVRVAVGTDSLASTPDLNVFAELATLRRLAPAVPASMLLDSATRQGARALAFDDEYGTLDSGKVARLLAVDVPPGTDDVEEYLVSGIQPEQVKWVEG
jgi:cytosine/adenosine deaminase-related metal-dependent hydrolase